MKFYMPDLAFDLMRSRGYTGTLPELIDRLANAYLHNAPNARTNEVMSLCGQLNMEHKWISKCRPYFKVWPAIADALTKTKLDVSPSVFSLPCDPIAVRFSEEDDRFKMIQTAIIGTAQQSNLGFPVLFMSYGTNQETYGESADKYGACVLVRMDRTTIEEGLYDRDWRDPTLKSLSPVPQLDARDILVARIAIAISFLANDPEFIKPDVLADDRRRFDESTDPEERARLVEKARKRGIVGWRIGEEYETIPHIRRPHFALFHTGKGRTIPRILPVKGCVVHRNKLTEVPTGHILPDGTEVEK